MVREVAAFVRQDFLTQTSYKAHTLVTLGGMVALMVPVYYIATALQPLMADSIAEQGGHYFGFLVIGLAAQRVISAATYGLPLSVSSAIRTGTLEALFATPVRLPVIVIGMMGYRVLWGFVEGLILVGVGWMLGASFVPIRIPEALFIILLVAIAYAAFGVMGAAAVLAFRTMGSLTSTVMLASVFLGGVFYPTRVIPSWLEEVSGLVPLTYGLRALRKMVLEGLSVIDVVDDLAILLGFTLLLLAIGSFLFRCALDYARRSGSLAQY